MIVNNLKGTSQGNVIQHSRPLATTSSCFSLSLFVDLNTINCKTLSRLHSCSCRQTQMMCKESNETHQLQILHVSLSRLMKGQSAQGNQATVLKPGHIIKIACIDGSAALVCRGARPIYSAQRSKFAPDLVRSCFCPVARVLNASKDTAHFC